MHVAATTHAPRGRFQKYDLIVNMNSNILNLNFSTILIKGATQYSFVYRRRLKAPTVLRDDAGLQWIASPQRAVVASTASKLASKASMKPPRLPWQILQAPWAAEYIQYDWNLCSAYRGVVRESWSYIHHALAAAFSLGMSLSSQPEALLPL